MIHDEQTFIDMIRSPTSLKTRLLGGGGGGGGQSTASSFLRRKTSSTQQQQPKWYTKGFLLLKKNEINKFFLWLVNNLDNIRSIIETKAGKTYKKFAKIIPSAASLSSTRYKTEVPIARSIELLQLKWKQIRIAAKNYILQKNKKNISSSSSMSSSSMSRMTGRSSSVVFTATQTLLILTKNIIDVQHRECVVLQ